MLLGRNPSDPQLCWEVYPIWCSHAPYSDGGLGKQLSVAPQDHNNHSGTAHGLDFKSTSPLRDTEDLLAPAHPGHADRGSGAGGGTLATPEPLPGAKIGLRDCPFPLPRMPRKIFYWGKRKLGIWGKHPAHSPYPSALSDHHFNREPLWDPGHTGPVNTAHASSHTRSWDTRRGEFAVWGWEWREGGGVLFIKNKIIKFKSVEGAAGLK